MKFVTVLIGMAVFQVGLSLFLVDVFILWPMKIQKQNDFYEFQLKIQSYGVVFPVSSWRPMFER